MAAVVVKVFAAVFVGFVAVAGDRVMAQTHHVLGGDGGLDVGSWLSGRVFRVGDKIWFNRPGTEETIVELKGPEELESCDVTNPIRMYTDPESHVELEEEGIRYFASGNPESCKNGLKLPVPVQPHGYGPHPPFGPPEPEYGPPEPEYGPPQPVRPPPHSYGSPPPPEPVRPPHSHEPPQPVRPPHSYGSPPPPGPVRPPHSHGPPPPSHGPPEPVDPPPSYGTPPPPPRAPSAATFLNGLSFVLFAGLLICYMGI